MSTLGIAENESGRTPTEEKNVSIMRRFVDELWNKQNLGVIDEVCSQDLVLHNAIMPGLPLDRDGFRMAVAGFQRAFSDTRTAMNELMAEGDRVAFQWTYSGKHSGEGIGMPPTNKRVTLTGISIFRLRGGKITERWDEADSLSMMQQLGVVPSQ